MISGSQKTNFITGIARTDLGLTIMLSVNAVLTRDISTTTVAPGDTFTLSYTAVSPTFPWFYSIIVTHGKITSRADWF